MILYLYIYNNLTWLFLSEENIRAESNTEVLYQSLLKFIFWISSRYYCLLQMTESVSTLNFIISRILSVSCIMSSKYIERVCFCPISSPRDVDTMRPNVVLRRWPNIIPALFQHLVFTWNLPLAACCSLIMYNQCNSAILPACLINLPPDCSLWCRYGRYDSVLFKTDLKLCYNFVFCLCGYHNIIIESLINRT